MAAATANISLTSSGWTLIASSGTAGLLSNTTKSNIIVRKADSLPSSSEDLGHPIKSLGSINVDLTDAAETGNLYGRIGFRIPSVISGEVVFTEA